LSGIESENMTIPDNNKTVGCWSGLCALILRKNKGQKAARVSLSTGSLSDKKAEALENNTGAQNTPPDYCAPPYNNTQFPAKAKHGPESSSLGGVHVPHKLPSPAAANTSDHAIDKSNGSLRELSLQIHDHPELRWDVKYAHDVLTRFVEERGFQVTRQYLADQLPGNTAWKAEFVIPDESGKPLPVIGLNSEMDALPGIGHACGHNLIAIVGVATALGLKAAMEEHKIPGKIVLLGTPAEEGGEGKVHLLKAGAYKEMDICLMAHPITGGDRLVQTTTTLALQTFEVEYHGQGAHAGAAPWEGRNALDAAFVAYTALSALRQQIHPTARVHGIIEGRDWASNVIPNYAKMRYTVRAPTWSEVVALRARVNRCFEAAAHATSCTMTITEKEGMKDVRVNEILAHELGAIMTDRYDHPFSSEGSIGGSTDFGSVTYELPALHPMFALSTVPNGGNHTPEFTAAARTQEAHERAIIVSKGLATLGLRALLDEEFLSTIKSEFERDLL
ncbi:Peptidase dimerization domain, partial [Rhizoctonia solani]